jgi:ribosomal protein S6
MKLYELNYLILPDLSEEELNATQNKINDWVREEKGILGEINKPVKKILAYPIKKSGQAYLGYLKFQIDAEKLTNLEKKLKSEGKIIRYLVLAKKSRKTEKAPRRMAKKFISPIIKAEVPKKEKAELEAIEQKLEEILKET